MCEEKDTKVSEGGFIYPESGDIDIRDTNSTLPNIFDDKIIFDNRK